MLVNETQICTTPLYLLLRLNLGTALGNTSLLSALVFARPIMDSKMTFGTVSAQTLFKNVVCRGNHPRPSGHMVLPNHYAPTIERGFMFCKYMSYPVIAYKFFNNAGCLTNRSSQ